MSLLKERSFSDNDDSEIIMPKYKTSRKIIRKLQIQLTEEERFSIAKSLAEKKAKIHELEKAKKEALAAFKAELTTVESDLASDILAVNTGVREIENAECNCQYYPQERKVRTYYQDTIIEERAPKKEDEELFSSVMFPEHEPPLDMGDR